MGQALEPPKKYFVKYCESSLYSSFCTIFNVVISIKGPFHLVRPTKTRKIQGHFKPKDQTQKQWTLVNG